MEQDVAADGGVTGEEDPMVLQEDDVQLVEESIKADEEVIEPKTENLDAPAAIEPSQSIIADEKAEVAISAAPTRNEEKPLVAEKVVKLEKHLLKPDRPSFLLCPMVRDLLKLC